MNRHDKKVGNLNSVISHIAYRQAEDFVKCKLKF